MSSPRRPPSVPNPWQEARGLIDRSFREKILLVGMARAGSTSAAVEASLDELSLLVETAGAIEAGRLLQHRDRPDPAYFIGRGKVDELASLSRAVDADTVVFDDELTPAQKRNLTAMLGRTAIDRTAVILDIFAQNATTREGRAQVELALLRYRLPHLVGRGSTLSQQAGGIGTRGPGETKLETDRRRLVRRMHRLEQELDQLARTRDTQSRARLRSELPSVAIVGYTNAGKSTLLNRLTDADALVADRLFATLDPRVRRMRLPSGDGALVSDTVGFVRKLPHQLVQAFHSTLEVARQADLLLHLVDASAPDPEGQVDAVRSVLDEIGAAGLPELLVLNKIDQADDFGLRRLSEQLGGPIGISARSGEGAELLLDALQLRLTSRPQKVLAVGKAADAEYPIPEKGFDGQQDGEREEAV